MLSKEATWDSQAAVVRIKDFVAGKVARHKRLQGGVVCVNEIPRLMSGKIKKKIVNEWAKEDEKRMEQRVKSKL